MDWYDNGEWIGMVMVYHGLSMVEIDWYIIYPVVMRER